LKLACVVGGVNGGVNGGVISVGGGGDVGENTMSLRLFLR
jgi:hypothetical protein